jgi:hypothetical protein
MERPKNIDIMTELGATGLSIYSGRIYEEKLPRLQGDGWRLALQDMQNDAVIGAMQTALEMLSRQVSWDIEPYSDDREDQKEAEFFRQCLFEDMAVTWQDTLSEIMSFLYWGWYFPEICYKRRAGESRDKTKDSKFSDGKIGWRKFAPRAQESLEEWELDEFGEVVAMIQRPEPDYELRRIPFEKALHFRTSSHKGNPEGRSIYRNAYREWYFKVNIQNIEGIGIERDLAGLPVIKAPAELFSADASESEKNLLRMLQQTVKQVRRDEAEGIVMPRAFDDNGHELFDFMLLSTGGRRQFDTNLVIDRCDHRMLMSILADFLLLGSKSVGSYALSTDKTEIFTSALSAWLDVICNQFNRYAIPRLQKLNGSDTKRSPRLVHGEVERISLNELGEYIRQLSGANISFDDEEIDFLKRKAIPPSKQKNAKKDAKNAKKTASGPDEEQEPNEESEE